MPSFPYRTVALLLVASSTLGCGDDATIVTATSDTSATSSNTNTNTTSNTTSTDPSTTAAESTATTSTPTSSSTETATSSGSETSDGTVTAPDTTTTSSSDTSTSTAATTTDTDGPEDAEYAARYVAGGLDRIFIRKAEKTGDLCTHVGLVWPELNDDYAIATPAGWSVELVAIAEGAAGCLDFDSLAPLPVNAVAAAGTVLWIDEGFCPPTLDIDVTAEFVAGDLPWVPMKDQLFADALPIEGCS